VRLIDNVDRWSHGGADNIYIDGEGEHPVYLRGVGGEDTFGTAWGGAVHTPETHHHAAMPYYVHEDVSEARPAQRLVGYRFFDEDSLVFRESIQMRFGCMQNDICSTVYWYQDGPVRPFFRMPEWPDLLPWERESPVRDIPRGTYDLDLPTTGAWWLCGPFANDRGQAMSAELPPETSCDPSATYDGLHGTESGWLTERSRERGRNVARWVRHAAHHGFVDFRHVFRPAMRGASPTYPGVALARCVLAADRDTTATLCLAWDDRLVLRLSSQPPIDMGHNAAFRARTVDVKLSKGENVLVLKLSNQVGSNWGGWAFAFSVRTPDGRRILPAAT
jgi:hypothetical protein